LELPPELRADEIVHVILQGMHIEIYMTSKFILEQYSYTINSLMSCTSSCIQIMWLS